LPGLYFPSDFGSAAHIDNIGEFNGPAVALHVFSDTPGYHTAAARNTINLAGLKVGSSVPSSSPTARFHQTKNAGWPGCHPLPRDPSWRNIGLGWPSTEAMRRQLYCRRCGDRDTCGAVDRSARLDMQAHSVRTTMVSEHHDQTDRRILAGRFGHGRSTAVVISSGSA
jgi:hypothetical protein